MRVLLAMELKEPAVELILEFLVFHLLYFQNFYEWFLKQFCLKNLFHCMKDYLPYILCFIL